MDDVLTIAPGWRKFVPPASIAQFILPILSLLFMLYVVVEKTAESDSIRRPRCDAALAAFMKTDSLVELERSKFLLKELDCSLETRLRNYH